MSGADAAGDKSGDVAKQYLKGIREAALAKHVPPGPRQGYSAKQGIRVSRIG